MKLLKYIYNSLWICGVMLIASCSSGLIVDDILDNVGAGAVLRNLGETNNLDISNGGSTYSIVLEAQDPSGGDELQEVRVNVGFNDIDDAGTDTVAMSAFATIPASAFNETSPTTNGLPVATFTVTLSDLVGHIGSSLANIAAEDVFVIDFEMVLTDGRIFNRGNATGDVTRTGRFSFFNAQFRYSASVGDPQRLVAESISIADDNDLGRLSSGDRDTVFVTFDRNPSFVNSPTITRTSTSGATDDTIGTLTADPDDDDNERFFFLYTAGATTADTVSFTIGSGSVVAGFTMEDIDLDNAYIIDNVAPSGQVGNVVVTRNAGSISSITVTLNFAEQLGEDDVVITATSTAFDTETIDLSIVEGSIFLTVELVPTVSGAPISDAAFSFDLTTDVAGGAGAGISDLIGNETSRTYTVDIL